MSTGIRASVKQQRPGVWIARAALTGPHAAPDHAFAAYAPSHAEAMQLAWLMLSYLDTELMNEVHASRANRRQEKTA